MVWTPDFDDFSGLFCNQGKYPLLRNMNEAWSPGDVYSKSNRHSNTAR